MIGEIQARFLEKPDSLLIFTPRKITKADDFLSNGGRIGKDCLRGGDGMDLQFSTKCCVIYIF